jgi:ABC-type protease/lipase transport system fused ATPase/permease subunit
MPEVARATLDRIERAQRIFKLALFAGALIEMLLIGALLYMVDLSDRVQALIFVSSVGGYTLLALGLVMLASHVERALLRAVQGRS